MFARLSRFRDKVCVITGGASGIGRAVGVELARHGARVTLADIAAEQAEAAATAIVEAGGQARAAALNVTDAAAVAALVEATAAEQGRLDYLFNNAGIVVPGEAHEHTLEDWYRTLDIDVRGVVHGVHAAYPLMIEQGGGHIVNTASVAGLIPAGGEVAYVAAKHAVVGMSTALRAEGAGLGVKVSVICPGFVDTPILFENTDMRNVQESLQIGSREDMKKLFPFRTMPADRAARTIVRGVACNKAIIMVTLHARFLWWVTRLSPALAIWLSGRVMNNVRKKRRGGG